MRRLIIILLLNFPVLVGAQCDSASVRQWLQSVNTDTVSVPPDIDKCPTAGFQSCITFNYDSSYFHYHYRDSVSGLWSSSTYYNFELREYHYNTPNDTTVYQYYDPGKCTAYIVVKTVVNDSLTRISKKRKTFYEFYSEIVFDDSGTLIVSYVETIVIKRGKKFRRTVYIRTKRKFNKEKIRMKRI